MRMNTLALFISASLVLTLLYLFSWLRFQKYQFLERDYSKVALHPEYSTGWHLYKGLNQLIFFTIMIILVGLPIAMLNMTVYWILHDGIFNITVLKQGFWYIGKTAKTDKHLQKLTKLINIPFKNKISVDLVAASIKIILLITSIIFINFIF